MPFEDLTGSSGFTSDSEGANANLDITMSEDSARNLWDVQAAVQQIAADFQTAVRAASDFNSYLISIRETSQTVKMPSGLGMEGGEGGNMSYSGGRVDTGSVPIVQSDLGMAGRIGEMEENASGMGGGAIAAASAARAFASGQPGRGAEILNQLTQAAWLASAGGGRDGGGGATGGAFQAEYNWARNNPNDPAVMFAPAQGGAPAGTPHAYAAARMISQNLPAAQQFLRGGGVGGIAGGLSRLGVYGAVGYAGYQLVDEGIQQYVQSRSMSIAANNSDNGLGWGFQQKINAAIMGASPFVTGDQANQIYGAAIAQGWGSRANGGFNQGTFGQAVNFMYGAAKDYNMDPAQSAQLLQTNSLGAGESVQALSEQLLTLKMTLDGTGVSTEAANAGFQSFTSQLIAAGASGNAAAQVAGGALYAFSGNSYLGPTGRGQQIFQSVLGSQQGQNVLAGLTGTIPGAVSGDSHFQASTAEMDKLNKRFTDQVLGMHGLDPDERAAMFQQLYNGTFGTNISQQDASNLMATYASNPNALTKGQQEYREKSKISYNSGDKAKSAWDRYTGDIREQASNGPWGYLSYASSWFTAAPNLFNWTSGDTENTVRNYSPQVRNILDNSANPDQVTVRDESGNVVATGKNEVSKWFNDPSNYQKFSASGSKYTLKDQNVSYNATNIGNPVDTGDYSQGINDRNTIHIVLSSDAKKLIDTDKKSFTLDTGYNG